MPQIKITDRIISIHSKKSKKLIALYQTLLSNLPLSATQLAYMTITDHSLPEFTVSMGTIDNDLYDRSLEQFLDVLNAMNLTPRKVNHAQIDSLKVLIMELSMRILALALDSSNNLEMRCQCLRFLYQFHNKLLDPKLHFGFSKTYSDLLTAQAEVATLWISASSITKHERIDINEVINTNLELVSSSKRQIQRCLVVLMGGNEKNKLRWSELLSDEAIETTYETEKNSWIINPRMDSNVSIHVLFELLGQADCIIDLLKAINDVVSSTRYLPMILKQLDLLALDVLLENFFYAVGVQDERALKHTKVSPRALQSEMGYYHEVVQQQKSARERSHFTSLQHLGHLSHEQEMNIMHYLQDDLLGELSKIFDLAKLLNCRLCLPQALSQKNSVESYKSTSSTLYRDDSVSGFDNARSDSESLKTIFKDQLRSSAFFKTRAVRGPVSPPNPPHVSEDSSIQSIFEII